MMRILSMVGAPFVGVATVIGAMRVAVTKGLVGSETAFWLTPTLIAVVLLIATVMVIMRRMTVLAWPLGVGFLTQSIGLLMLWLSDEIRNPWSLLWWTLGAMGTVVLVMLIVYAVSTIRARLLERELAKGAGGDEEDVERIRNDMLEALEMLRRAGRGRNAIYELPWYLVMGRPAAGKTVAIKNSELGLPVKRDWVKGVGGTYTADWFFTNEMIFLDTPGKWVTEGANQDGQTHWRELVRLLSKYRGRQPLDGLIIVVPADDLLTFTEQQLEDQAANIREVVDLIHAELNFRFPIYMLISKSDLVSGFVDFAKLLPAKRRPEIFGWSNSDPNEHDVEELIDKGFKHLNTHIARYRIEMLAKVARRSVARRLFFFSEELKALQAPFLTFAEAFFSGDRYSDSPVFRGFYFTSGTQEGTAMSKAMADLSRTLGVTTATTSDAGEPENKRSYFLLDLFRELMVGDEGLVGRTAGHRWKLRRNTFLGAFAPAGIALLFLLLSSIAYVRNNVTYGNLEDKVAGISSQLGEASDRPVFAESIEGSLEQTGKLLKYHRQMVTGDWFRRFGMRRPGPLEAESFNLFESEFRHAVLEPTLFRANELATNRMGEGTEVSCLDRIEVLASVVFLRGASRAGWENMDGLDQVWGFSGLGADRADAVRESLLDHYAHVVKHSEGDLLPGFDVGEVAASIARDCADQGALSTLALYRDFQKECRFLEQEEEAVEDCWDRLQTVLNNASTDYEAFGRRFKKLQGDLEELHLERGVMEAQVASRELAGIAVPTAEKSGKCLNEFDVIAKSVEEFVIQNDLLAECQEELKTAKSKQRTLNDVIKRHRTQLEPEQSKLGQDFGAFSANCGSSVPGFEPLEIGVVENVATRYRRLRCYKPERRRGRPEVVATPVRVAVPVPQRPKPSPQIDSSSSSTPAPARPVNKITSSAAPRNVRSSRYLWFEAPAAVSKYYKLEKWPQQEEQWLASLEAAEGYEKDDVLKNIAGYAVNFTKAWQKYLESLELKSGSGDIENWLQELAKTDEYEQVLGPAMEAAAIKPEGPLEFVAPKLKPLQQLGELDIGEYQGFLEILAEDIGKCRTDPQAFQAFRTAYEAGDRNNPLIQAKRWVASNAGSSVLRDLFEKPLAGVETFVKSDTLLIGKWNVLRGLYAESISGRPPFGGDMVTDEAASFESIRALLGGENGAVAQVRLASGGQPMDAATEAWLRRAEELSALFFKEESDDPRTVGFSLELAPLDFSKKKQSKSLEVRAVEIEFADDKICEIDLTDQAGKRSCVVKLKLIGDEASEKSTLAGIVAKSKALALMRPGTHKPGQRIEGVLKDQPDSLAEAEGTLAPLKLLSMGWTNRNTLEFALRVPLGKKNDADIALTFDISGNDASLLWKLLQEGLPAPPRSIRAGGDDG